MKTKSGAGPPYESIIIVTFAYDEGWTLKIGQIKEFVNSLTHAGSDDRGRICDIGDGS